MVDILAGPEANVPVQILAVDLVALRLRDRFGEGLGHNWLSTPEEPPVMDTDTLGRHRVSGFRLVTLELHPRPGKSSVN